MRRTKPRESKKELCDLMGGKGARPGSSKEWATEYDTAGEKRVLVNKSAVTIIKTSEGSVLWLVIN